MERFAHTEDVVISTGLPKTREPSGVQPLCGDDYDRLCRIDLYDLARARGIQERSRLSRAELIEALRRHSLY